MFHAYIQNLNQKFQTGLATEHTFRGDLQNLLSQILPADYVVMNEPKRQACGAPDYIIEKNGIAVGFIEAKDIGDKDLLGEKKTGNKEQFDRYKASLANLVFTDYLRFYFFKNGELVQHIHIGEIQQQNIIALPQNFKILENLFKDFVQHTTQSIKSPKKLAEMMASKARLLADVIEKSLNNDEAQHADSSLHDQMHSFKQILIHDITHKQFADVYAQTITYGLFAARLHDPTLPTFSRQEAMELIPKTNPFLRNLFSYISGINLDDRIKWIVDSLADVFLHCDVREILKNYGRSTKTNEPIIHFYETFLSEYDASLRKARGVWYTPTPVVDFIVRAVDDVLKHEFGFADGIADDRKTIIQTEAQGTAIAKGKNKGQKIYQEKEVHQLQILDPATGTGTFLSAVVRHIYQSQFQGMQGAWSDYVEQSLIPRLNGFELLMASYAMAHLQLDLLLAETGYQATGKQHAQRFKIYLINSLEESHADTGTLFTSWLSNEANEANFIKRDTPVMVVMGNPPYSISSSNKSSWILDLLDDYKKDLNEKNIQPLSDDYIKFIRYGQYFIDRNESGVLAYIANNSFIDGLTHRQMRKSLLESFDKIYIVDLHGNAKKKETAPDGSKDENVFDIMQGVSINIFIKKGKKKKGELAQVYHYDVYGKRNDKYDFLNDHSLASVPFQELVYSEPNYFFVPKDFGLQDEYDGFFKIDELFVEYNNGIETGKDSFFYSMSKGAYLNELKEYFCDKDKAIRYFEISDSTSFKFLTNFKKANFDEHCIRQVSFRPFDVRYCYYDAVLQRRPAFKIMKNMFNDNVALLVPRQFSGDFTYVYVSQYPTDCNLTGTAKKYGSSPIFPLYLYTETLSADGNATLEKTANFNNDILNTIAAKLGLTFSLEITDDGKFTALNLLDYIYAVLHSPSYRAKYQEFLKIDFPRIPYPQDKKQFFALANLGERLRLCHLMQGDGVKKIITQYPVQGDNVVGKIRFVANENATTGKVYINDTQYFDDVPQSAWAFFIGGYQPAQKWLKDRKDRSLSHHDIRHYGQIIAALCETMKTMEEIERLM